MKFKIHPTNPKEAKQIYTELQKSSYGNQYASWDWTDWIDVDFQIVSKPGAFITFDLYTKEIGCLLQNETTKDVLVELTTMNEVKNVLKNAI